MKTKRYAFCSISENQTESVGKRLAELVKGLICIEGNLGAGKTVLTRGIARGLNITDYITSPTFNIINVYEKNGLIFNHMDAYRITDTDMLQDIGFDEMLETGNITVIEWADMIYSKITDCSVYVKMLNGDSENKRIIILEADEEIINRFIGSLI